MIYVPLPKTIYKSCLLYQDFKMCSSCLLINATHLKNKSKEKKILQEKFHFSKNTAVNSSAQKAFSPSWITPS